MSQRQAQFEIRICQGFDGDVQRCQLCPFAGDGQRAVVLSDVDNPTRGQGRRRHGPGFWRQQRAHRLTQQAGFALFQGVGLQAGTFSRGQCRITRELEVDFLNLDRLRVDLALQPERLALHLGPKTGASEQVLGPQKINQIEQQRQQDELAQPG